MIGGRTLSNMRRDDAIHRETLAAVIEPTRAGEAGKALGVSAETCAARLRKYVQAGMVARLHSGQWCITQAGRDALAGEELISLRAKREEMPESEPEHDLWALLLGARRPRVVTGKLRGKMRMSAPI